MIEGSLPKKISMNMSKGFPPLQNIPVGEEKMVISDQGGRNSLFTLPQNITLFLVFY
jgi:hypothetical protein